MNMNMKLGKRGEILIKSYETLRLTGYFPTPDDKPTAGWGHTGPDVEIGREYTLYTAGLWFTSDTASAVKVVNAIGVKLTQSMFDALVSIVFNVGPGCVSGNSTIGRALRSGDYLGAWAGFALWRKQGKKDLLGLARRRAGEMCLFLEDGLQK